MYLKNIGDLADIPWLAMKQVAAPRCFLAARHRPRATAVAASAGEDARLTEAQARDESAGETAR